MSTSTAKPVQAAVEYEVRSDLPAGELVIPIQTLSGFVVAVRQGPVTPELLRELHDVYEILSMYDTGSQE